MENIINIHIEKLPEGLYLATSEDIQGLVAQGRTVTETIEIARDIAKKLLETQSEPGKDSDNKNIKMLTISKSFDYPLIVGT
jgi:predicted RNase H-like HicB family nuclease